MVMPKVEVDVTADTTQANASMEVLEKKIKDVDKAATKSTGSMGKGAGPVEALGKKMKSTGHHTANLTAQFNDIGVMMAAGQSPLVLALQQGTQINQMWQTMGVTGKDALKTIGSGLKAMVTPINLATIGIIAGGAALFQWGMSAMKAGEDASAFTERLEAAREASDNLEESLRSSTTGRSADELAFLDARVKAENTVLATRERLLALPISRENADLIAQEERKLSAAEAVLATAEQELATYRAQITAKKALASEAQNYDVVMSQVVDTSTENENIVSLMKDGIKASTIQAMQLSGVDLAGPIGNAAVEAAKMAESLGVSFEQAQNISRILKGNTGIGREDPVVMDPRDPRFNQTASTMAGFGVDKEEDKKNGGRGGGGMSPEETRAQELEMLIESLRTEEEVLAEWHAASKSQLEEANSQELTILGGHADAKLRLEEEYQRRKNAISQSGLAHEASMVLGAGEQILSAIGQNNDKALRLAKVFGAAKALINTYEGASEALKLPFPANLGAAASVISAGIGFVSSIKGASAGATGGRPSLGGGGGGGFSPQPSGGNVAGGGGSQPQISRELTIYGDFVSREQAYQIAEWQNEGAENGLIIRGRR